MLIFIFIVSCVTYSHLLNHMDICPICFLFPGSLQASKRSGASHSNNSNNSSNNSNNSNNRNNRNNRNNSNKSNTSKHSTNRNNSNSHNNSNNINNSVSFNFTLPVPLPHRAEYERKILMEKRKRQRTTKDPDCYEVLEDYIKTKGDPATNGLGHSIVEYEGEQCVHIPGARKWWVRQEDIQDIVDKTKVDSSKNLQLVPQQMDVNFRTH